MLQADDPEPGAATVVTPSDRDENREHGQNRPDRSDARGTHRWRWSALVALACVALWLVLAPAWALRPFSPQNAAMVARAYAMRRVSPIATLLALAAVAWLGWRQWRGARWPARTAIVLLIAVVGLTAGIARLNHFELMFHPLRHPGYAPAAAAAAFVKPQDMVLAVQAGGDAAAYPIRQIAYHHVVLDTVGGVPIAVTY